MAYKTTKVCESCQNKFECNSNSQIYCDTCKPQIRQERQKKYNQTYYQNTRTEKLEYSKTYNESIKGKAAEKLRAAVRSGKIQRQPCEVCQKPKAEGHHFDYSKPLEVKWLCRQHHAQTHLYKPWQNEMIRAGYEGGFLLAELIEACGIWFFELFKLDNDTWHAGTKLDDNRPRYETGTGKTPEEAVAKLWLALNASKEERTDEPHPE